MLRVDPENNETRALLAMLNFNGQHVLEIGCGDGRVTWRYAGLATHVMAIDSSAGQIALARQQVPPHLRKRIEFQETAFEDFAAASQASAFDIVILSHSL